MREIKAMGIRVHFNNRVLARTSGITQPQVFQPDRNDESTKARNLSLIPAAALDLVAGSLSMGSSVRIMMTIQINDSESKRQEQYIDGLVKTNLRLIKRQNHEIDTKGIWDAYVFAKEALQGTYRYEKWGKGMPFKGKIPRILHAVRQSLSLSEHGVYRPDMHKLALNHDVIEDSDNRVNEANVRARLGDDIAVLVNQVTKYSQRERRTEQEVENIRTFIANFVQDIRAFVAKLFDNLDNMRTIRFLPEDRREAFAQECQNLYVPLEGAFGVWKFKIESEDLAFKALEEIKYQRAKKSGENYENQYLCTLRRIRMYEKRYRQGMIDFAKRLEGRLNEGLTAGYKVEKTRVEVCKRGVKEVHKIIQRGEAPDILYLSVLTPDLEQLQRAIGIVSSEYPLETDFVKPFLSRPRPNGFKAHRLRLVNPFRNLKKVMVQFSTYDMDERNQYGILSNYRGKAVRNIDTEYLLGDFLPKAVNHLRLVEGKIEVWEIGEIFSGISTPIQIYSINNKEYQPLPVGSTVLDYAYSKFGERARYLSMVKIGSIDYQEEVKFDHVLSDQESVEFEFASQPTIEPSWLRYASFPQTEVAIRQDLKLLPIDIQKRFARKELFRLGRKFNLNADNVRKLFGIRNEKFYKELNQLLGREGEELLSSQASVLSAIGRGEIDAQDAIEFYIDWTKRESAQLQSIQIEIPVGNFNIPGFLGAVTNVLGELGFNINFSSSDKNYIRMETMVEDKVREWQLKYALKMKCRGKYGKWIEIKYSTVPPPPPPESE